MFKAKLIEDSDYYRRRRFQLMLFFLPAIPVAFIINYYNFPVWISILMLGIYITIIILTIRNSKQLRQLSQGRMIEIEENLVRVKYNNKHSAFEINLDEVDKISVPSDYGIPSESLPDMTRELGGRPKKNFIIFSNGNHHQRFDFVIDSHYMLTQLENVVQTWIKKGYIVEKAVI